MCAIHAIDILISTNCILVKADSTVVPDSGSLKELRHFHLIKLSKEYLQDG